MWVNCLFWLLHLERRGSGYWYCTVLILIFIKGFWQLSPPAKKCNVGKMSSMIILEFFPCNLNSMDIQHVAVQVLGQLTLGNSWFMLAAHFCVGFEKLTRKTALWESAALKLCTDSLHFFREVKALRTGFQKCSSSNYVPRCFRDLLVTQQALHAIYLLLSCFWSMTLSEKQLLIEQTF